MIGTRVREALRGSGLTQAALARSVGLSESALSKSLAGTRTFAALELAEVAERLGVSMHWLVTGEEDPFEVRVVARHSYDNMSRTYSCDPQDDQKALEAVALLYRQAYAA
ncbi:XRE family transcriptional regulator [Actinomyces lilanjuaniae]|uniref:XRE family transcriptional regulator n=1 Tax=Actinomyces lilanjuaniae TaxID=2321394 RepID=A0ABN5PQH1_9ACTO|nr:helix-turn-helix transcriptional regulator [Actinomyces lilanjuaniae]AYD89077.1 XRE family transcriptional regulator [Actinomyces lilanjuaniae]